MIKIIKLDSIPENALIKTGQYHTKTGLETLASLYFGGEFKDLEVGPSYVIAEVPNDYSGRDDIPTLLEKSSKIRAYSYTSLDVIREIAREKLEKALTNEKSIETELGMKIENHLHKIREVGEDSIYVKMY